MTFTKDNLRTFMVGTEENRVEALKELLGYPVLQRDPQGSQFWYLRPGENEDEALETCPIAVGFYSELNSATDQEIKKILTSQEKQQEIYGHYANREFEQQPVMYLLLPTKEGTGRVPLVLPTEGGLRQRQIETFQWNDAELIARLNRLKQRELPIATKAVCSIPQVDWVFYPAAKTAGELARALAEAARRIEQTIPKVYKNEGTDGYLHNLLKSFQRELLPKLQLTSDNEKDYSFADIYAQTIAYALFTARVFGYATDKREGREKETHFDRESAWQQLPETNPFLRKLFEDISKQTPKALGDELIGAIADIFGILRAAKMEAILSDFQLKMNREDIVIRFYEDFLAAYKPQMRERRGVYYTPEPVVSYMVRSVDQLLKDKFNKPLGLASPEVMILDPACGTGTFLLWICQLIYQRFQESPEALTEGLTDKSWSGYVRERLLPRIFGFELLMAPYAIAHLKLGLFLEETGYQFSNDKRLGVYLSNTLEDSAYKDVEQLSLPGLGDILAKEASEGAKLKKQEPIMIVIGNPPYSGHSANTNKWIKDLINTYKENCSELSKPGQAKWLSDDYVKFIRFAQWRIDNTGYGILAMITNNGYLDNPTFRGMRQSLMKSFDEMYLLNLHGNTKKKEYTPDGDKDENVFDIQQGVAITLAIKNRKNKKNTVINSHDYWGKREIFDVNKINKTLIGGKYYRLWNDNFINETWMNLFPNSPLFLFTPQNNSFQLEYDEGWKISDIFNINGDPAPGIVTTHDEFAIAWNQNEIIKKVEMLLATNTEEQARNIFRLCSQEQWQYQRAKNELKNNLWRKELTKIIYRPFDTRWTVFNRNVAVHRRERVMRHMLAGENIGLSTTRSIEIGRGWEHIFCTENIIQHHTVSIKEVNYLFPLYLYPDNNEFKTSVLLEKRRPNLSLEFLKAITSKLGYTPTPEAIFYYIYSIFHSPTYRTRYAEFLKKDFPRVPLTNDDELFCQLAVYGQQLVALHLMKSPKLDNLITQFVENDGKCLVDAGYPKYNQGAVIINKKGDKFTGVPQQVWNFYIGGYQVCQKWLKDRKGCTLSDEDIQHYQRIVVSLKETIGIIEKIDEVIPGFPIT
ncbi:type ISP restriction/modification enzyme [Nostoc sp. UHCC 0870]|uniref:type ISP restriction/modification enzyme n=1 Tax=Nostoc sp. UHCC 0870 TaxID=2914041 RepID=UPI001EDF40D2|nr:type ISP restriction/modification enzyme [Nostoc sp. UHCC 0870]UKP01418.1 N-6 DNA methylase [Nostoc sp. UHCC 0870]